MHIIECFYSSQVRSSLKVLEMLNQLVEDRDDILLKCSDIETDAGIKNATRFEVAGIPTMIIDGESVIKGVPESTNQILRSMEKQ